MFKQVNPNQPPWLRTVSGRTPSLDFDFLHRRFFIRGEQRRDMRIIEELCTFTRGGTTGDYFDRGDGIYVPTINTSQLKLSGLGLRMDCSRTNRLLQNRDLTNAAFTKTNITAALDQIGITGAANSASSILATAGNATVTQGITLASGTILSGCWIKRLVGSGNIQLTCDNGTTWTTVTVTTDWTLVQIPVQTLANPTWGIRIVTSGDKVAVDFGVLETPGTGVDQSLFKRPILVGAAAVTINHDQLLLATSKVPDFNSVHGLIYAECEFDNNPTAGAHSFVSVTNSANELNDRVHLRIINNAISSQLSSGGVSQASINGNAISGGGIFRAAQAYNTNDTHYTTSIAIGAITKGTTDTVCTMPSGMNQFNFGGNNGDTNKAASAGFLRRVTYWPECFSDGELANLCKTSY